MEERFSSRFVDYVKIVLVESCFLEECILEKLTEVGDVGDVGDVGGGIVCVVKDDAVSGRIL